jgi:predicted transcriptional regulator
MGFTSAADRITTRSEAAQAQPVNVPASPPTVVARYSSEPICALTSTKAIREKALMAEHAEEQQREEPRSVAALTTEIVVAYFTKNTIAMADLGDLIAAVGRALEALGRKEPEPAKPEPAVSVRRSIQDDHLVCLVCGKQQKILRRHLAVAHQLTPAAYRELFGLRSDYPMAAPGYSRQRSDMAKRVGLGRREQVSARGRKTRSRG